jgi:hypothetical protein
MAKPLLTPTENRIAACLCDLLAKAPDGIHPETFHRQIDTAVKKLVGRGEVVVIPVRNGKRGRPPVFLHLADVDRRSMNSGSTATGVAEVLRPPDRRDAGPGSLHDLKHPERA